MESLQIAEVIETFEAGGATQKFTHSGVNSVREVLSRLRDNPDREYTFICRDEHGSLSLHSVDTLKNTQLLVGEDLVSL